MPNARAGRSSRNIPIAISGASLLQPGIQALIADARQGRFQVVLAEAMDRLSRDQA